MKEIEADLRAAMAVFDRERQRERNRRQRQRIVSCCKQMAAFLFSHVGLAAMVVAYSIMGGFLFQALEAPAEHQVRLKVVRYRDEKIDEIWLLANELASSPTSFITPTPVMSQASGFVRKPRTGSVGGVGGSTHRPPTTLFGEFDLDANETMQLRRKNFTEKVADIFKSFQTEVRQAVKDDGWDGNDSTDLSQLQWSFAGALLYAVTVITTIGYGHVAPKTSWGRLLTIVYALVGIPLTFLYLSNIGNFLADCFRLFYKRVCCDVLCCEKCDRKRRRLRLKLRRRREIMAAAAEQYTVRFEDEEDLGDRWDSAKGVAIVTGNGCSRLPRQNDVAQFALVDDRIPHQLTPDCDAKPLLQRHSTSGSEACTLSVRASSTSHVRREGGSDRQSSSSWSTTSSVADDDDQPVVHRNTRETAILDDEVDEDEVDQHSSERQAIADFAKLDNVRETAIIENSPASDRRRHPELQRPLEIDNEKRYDGNTQSETESDEDRETTEVKTSPGRPTRRHNVSLRDHESQSMGRRSLHCSADDITAIARCGRKHSGRITFGCTTTSDDPASANATLGRGGVRERGGGLRRSASEKRPGLQRRPGKSLEVPRLTVSSADGRKRQSSPIKLMVPGSECPTSSQSPTMTALTNWIHLRELLIQRQQEAMANGTAPSSRLRSPAVATTPSGTPTVLLSPPSSTLFPSQRNSPSVKRSGSTASRSVDGAATYVIERANECEHMTSSPAGARGSNGRFRRIVANLKRVTSRRPAGDDAAAAAAAAATSAKALKNHDDRSRRAHARKTDSLRRSRSGVHGSNESFVTAHSDEDCLGDDDTQSRLSSIGPDGLDDRPTNARTDNAVAATTTDTTLLTFDSGDRTVPPPMTAQTMKSLISDRSDISGATFRMISNSGFDPFDFDLDLDGDSSNSSSDGAKVTVPVSICLVIIAGYIFAGAVLFTLWEDWDLLTGSYFCFITLSTIGFGDIVPGTDMDKWASHEKLVLCALWLAFGLSLLAMCFNLMQEEVKEKCKWLGRKLGLLKDEGEAE